MKTRNLILAVLGLSIVAGLFWANRTTTPEQRPVAAESPKPATPSTLPTSAPPAAAIAETPRIPHFHASLQEAGLLPKILPASQFDIPIVARAYKVAARIPKVLAQQPCYCWCEKMGHGSLIDCFATDHGAG